MNTEAILRPKDESSPPPEPHSTAADITKCRSTQLADIWGESDDCVFSHLTGDPLLERIQEGRGYMVTRVLHARNNGSRDRHFDVNQRQSIDQLAISLRDR